MKNKVAIKLEAKYQDLLLFYNQKRICEPFCLVDLNILTETTIEVTIAEGAEIGLDKLREQIAKEVADDAARGEDAEEEMKE